MHTAMVTNEEEAAAATAEAEARGLRWAATSNAGLPQGQWRLTFIPASAFMKPDDPVPNDDM